MNDETKELFHYLDRIHFHPQGAQITLTDDNEQ